jgi:hypothetical protein
MRNKHFFILILVLIVVTTLVFRFLWGMPLLQSLGTALPVPLLTLIFYFLVSALFRRGKGR